MTDEEKTEDTPEEVTSGDTVEESTPAVEAPKPETAAPAPVSSDPLGDEKPTNPLVLVGAAVAVILLLVVIISSVSGGSPYDVPGASPDLTDGDEDKWAEGIKAAGESYVNFQEEKRWNAMTVSRDQGEDSIDRRSDRAVFYQDEEKVLKRNKRSENRLEFFDENDSALEDFKIEDIKTDEKGGHKVYTCTVKGKRMASSGDDGWKLEDRSEKYSLRFAWIGEEWRLVGRN